MNKHQPVKYDAMIIDPEMSTRMRLKSATTSVVQFGKVNLFGDLDETMRKIENGTVTQVLFISAQFSQEEVAAFIKRAKGTKAAQDAAYVLVLKAKDQESSTVTQNVLIGADGLLFEPYSVDQLVEITDLAARVKRERSMDREKAAFKFLLNDIINQVNLLAYLKSSGYDVSRGQKKLKQMCGIFETLTDESRAIYYDLAIQMFADAPFPTQFQKNYGGASSRVKKKMETKLLAELEADYVPPEAT